MCLIGATCSTFNKVSEIFHEMLRVIMCAHFINYKHGFSAKENFFLLFALFSLSNLPTYSMSKKRKLHCLIMKYFPSQLLCFQAILKNDKLQNIWNKNSTPYRKNCTPATLYKVYFHRHCCYGLDKALFQNVGHLENCCEAKVFPSRQDNAKNFKVEHWQRHTFWKKVGRIFSITKVKMLNAVPNPNANCGCKRIYFRIHFKTLVRFVS